MPAEDATQDYSDSTVEVLAPMGLVVKKIAGDGACAFHSLAHWFDQNKKLRS